MVVDLMQTEIVPLVCAKLKGVLGTHYNIVAGYSMIYIKWDPKREKEDE